MYKMTLHPCPPTRNGKENENQDIEIMLYTTNMCGSQANLLWFFDFSSFNNGIFTMINQEFEHGISNAYTNQLVT